MATFSPHSDFGIEAEPDEVRRLLLNATVAGAIALIILAFFGLSFFAVLLVMLLA